MLSLKNFAAIKVAVEICNNYQLKKEILCIFGSNYNENNTGYTQQFKKQWAKIVEKKAGIILNKLGLTKEQKEKIIGAVLSVGMRILMWAKYHEITIGFSRDYSFKFFNSSTFITPRGIVDCKRTAEEMLKDTRLTIKQKYKLALLYCMNQHIPVLDKQIPKKEKEEFYDGENPSKIQQPDFVKFWSYYLKDEVNKLRGDTDPNLYWLQMAVKSGSKDVVEYCLEKTNLIRDEGALIYAALEAVNNNIEGVNDSIVFNDFVEDGVWANSYREGDRIEQWVPNHYYIEILCFLFSKMRRDTQISFLKEDLRDCEQDSDFIYSRVLELFLDFPYQDYFLKTAKLMWDFLPHSGYVDVLENFIDKIGARKEYHEYGEGLFYDYKELLREFLDQIPEPNKIYIFRDYQFDDCYFFGTHSAGSMLLYHLYTQENYTYQDKIIVEWIIDNATNEEKEYIISSRGGALTCQTLIHLRRWRLTDDFLTNCYTSEVKVQKFKKDFIISESAYSLCMDFIVNEEWHEVESFIIWSTLTDVEINKLKEKMIYSDYGINACLEKVSCAKKLTVIDKVIKWCFPTNEKAAEFKKWLICSFDGKEKCKNLVTADQVDLANEFINWSLSSGEEIKHYKREVANEFGINVCESLIFSYKIEHNFRGSNNRSPVFTRSKWEKIEKFLTWCFTSEDEINNFKKTFTVKDVDGTRNRLILLHLILISNNKWEDAEIFFTWLSLSVEEIQKLKKETILSSECMYRIYTSVKRYPGNILDYAGGKWEKVELLFRWCLEDKYDVLEFKSKFDEVYGFKSYEDRREKIPENEKKNLNQFYLFIEEFLYDLYQQEIKHK